MTVDKSTNKLEVYNKQILNLISLFIQGVPPYEFMTISLQTIKNILWFTSNSFSGIELSKNIIGMIVKNRYETSRTISFSFGSESCSKRRRTSSGEAFARKWEKEGLFPSDF